MVGQAHRGVDGPAQLRGGLAPAGAGPHQLADVVGVAGAGHEVAGAGHGGRGQGGVVGEEEVLAIFLVREEPCQAEEVAEVDAGQQAAEQLTGLAAGFVGDLKTRNLSLDDGSRFKFHLQIHRPVVLGVVRSLLLHLILSTGGCRGHCIVPSLSHYPRNRKVSRLIDRQGSNLNTSRGMVPSSLSPCRNWREAHSARWKPLTAWVMQGSEQKLT